MTRRALALASLCLVVALLAAAWIVAARVPDGVRLPIHWNIDGNPDGFAGKWTALLIPPGVTAALALLFYALPAYEPRKEGLERSLALYAAVWAAVLVIFAAVDGTAIGVALGWAVPVPRVLTGALGAAFAIIGNWLGKSRSTYFMGVRTPWTLDDEEVWIKTHRLAGVMMTAGGLIALVAAFLPITARAHFLVLLGVVLAFVSVPTLYSWLLWRSRHPGSNA
jgi:uncharacterized membrane protein